MKSAADYQPSAGFGLLLQAPPKAGKTTLALQFPNPWIADCDNNLSGSLRWMAENKPDKLKTIKYDTINMAENGELTPDEARWPLLLTRINEALRDPTIKTIIIDSASSVSKYLEDYIVSKKGADKSKGMTISDWQPFRALISKLIIDLRIMAKGRFVIMTSHEESVKDEVTGIVHFRTNIPSKLADSFGGLFSDVWRCEVTVDTENKPVYTVRSIQTPRLPALGSSMSLPSTFQFTWDQFYTKFLAKYDTKKA